MKVIVISVAIGFILGVACVLGWMTYRNEDSERSRRHMEECSIEHGAILQRVSDNSAKLDGMDKKLDFIVDYIQRNTNQDIAR